MPFFFEMKDLLAAGKALDKPGLQAEGIAQQRKGEAQQALGRGKEAVKKVVDKA